MCFRISKFCALAKQPDRFSFVHRSTFTQEITTCESPHGIGIPFVGGFMKPFDTFLLVFGHTQTFHITSSESPHGIGIPLIRGFMIPLDSLVLVFGHTIDDILYRR